MRLLSPSILVMLIAAGISVPAFAMNSSPDPLETEIAALQLRVQQLKKLKELREEEKLLSASLNTGSAQIVEDQTLDLNGNEEREAPSLSDDKNDRYSQRGLRDNETGKQKFGGIEFGLGIAFTYDLGKNDRIKNAEIINDIVRVTQQENVRGRIMLESHYFFTPPKLELFGLKNHKGYYRDRTDDKGKFIRDDSGNVLQGFVPGEANIGIGPFVALQPGSDSVIEGIGAGLMVGMRRPKENSSESFNIGIGVFYDLNSKILGEGLAKNQPLPVGETLRFLETSQSGLLILSSYSF